MLSLLNGDWKLAYTSNSELLAILALGRLPFVTVGDITQRVDAATSTVENKARAAPRRGEGPAARARVLAGRAAELGGATPRGAPAAAGPPRSCGAPQAPTHGRAGAPTAARHVATEASRPALPHPIRPVPPRPFPPLAAPAPPRAQVSISAPLSRTAFSATAAFEVRSPKRIAVRFERGSVSTPQLLSDVKQPDSVTLLGQTLDLAPLRGALAPAEAALSGLLGAAGGLLERAPDLSFPLPGAADGRGETWLLTTYLDDGLRISRCAPAAAGGRGAHGGLGVGWGWGAGRGRGRGGWRAGGRRALGGGAAASRARGGRAGGGGAGGGGARGGGGGGGGGGPGGAARRLPASAPPPIRWPHPPSHSPARSGDGGSVFVLVKEAEVTSPSAVIEPGETPPGYI
jgi:hypothetical protein